MAKESSVELAALAGRVLAGADPTRDEIESLAASVLVQAEPVPSEPPGITDRVTVTVGKAGITEAVERGVVVDHPETVAKDEKAAADAKKAALAAESETVETEVTLKQDGAD